MACFGGGDYGLDTYELRAITCQPMRKRQSVELNEEQWAGLGKVARRAGVESWRTLLRKLAEGELSIGGAAAPAQPVPALPYAEPPKPVPVPAKPIPVPFVMPGQRDLSHRRDGAVPVLAWKR